MKKLLILTLLGLGLGGCKKNDGDSFNDSPLSKSGYSLGFVIVNEDSINLFPASLNDTNYAGHPLDPSSFKAFNPNYETIHEIGYHSTTGIIFSMYDLAVNYGENWGKSAGDTIISWLLCFGAKCDTLTMGVHTPTEASALQLSQFPFGQKWVVWQGDTLRDIPSQRLIIFKNWNR